MGKHVWGNSVKEMVLVEFLLLAVALTLVIVVSKKVAVKATLFTNLPTSL